MKKTAVIYWSGTGNTEAMANYVLEGAKSTGAEVDLYTPDAFTSDKVDDYEAFAFGCSAQGAEVLEEIEFEPMFADCEAKLAGKNVALFGSYGWGDGEWMREWEARCIEDGIDLTCASVTCNEAPDDAAAEQCRMLGKAIA